MLAGKQQLLHLLLIKQHFMLMVENSAMVQPHGLKQFMMVQQTIIAKWGYQH